jgi:hypothetical protein
VKSCLLLLLLFSAFLQAQIQVLPDIEVSGDSQIKIFLYKKALPYSMPGIARDSIMSFVPSSLPELASQNYQPTPGFRQYLNLQGDPSPGLAAYYRYYPVSGPLSDAKAMLSMRFPKKNMHSHHLHLGLDFAKKEEAALVLGARHFDTEMQGLDSKYTLVDLATYQDKLDFMDLNIRQMSNELRGYAIKQNRGNATFKTKGLGFTHQSLLDFDDFTWGNRLYLYAPKIVLHSFIELQQDQIDKFGIHVIQDGYRLFTVPGFRWHHIIDNDQEFSIENQPETLRNDFCELLETYRWLSFDASRRNTTIPLNLKIALENAHATDKGLFLQRFIIANSTKYKLNAPVLKDSPNPEVPELQYFDVFSNESGVFANFKRGRVVLNQAILLCLSYMPEESWLRQPYSALFKVESTLVYQSLPFEASLALNQHYFTLDHHRKSLPELIDLSLNAAYDLGTHSQVYLKAENLLNFPKWQFKSLLRQDTSLYTGFVHRF